MKNEEEDREDFNALATGCAWFAVIGIAASLGLVYLVVKVAALAWKGSL